MTVKISNLLKHHAQIITNAQGQAVLIVVLLTAAIGLMSVITAQRIELRQFSQIQRVTDIEKTYYATEGALHETLRHLTNDHSWPSSTNYSDSYVFNDVTINRTISSTTNGAGNQVRDVTIIGDLNGIKRQIGGDITLQGGSGPGGGFDKFDILFLLDESGSISGSDVTEMNQAIGNFLNEGISSGTLVDTRDKIGLITWGSTTDTNFSLNQEVGVNFNNFRNALQTHFNGDGVGGGNDIILATKDAVNEQLANLRPNAARIIIDISDSQAGRGGTPGGCCNGVSYTPGGPIEVCEPFEAENWTTSNGEWVVLGGKISGKGNTIESQASYNIQVQNSLPSDGWYEVKVMYDNFDGMGPPYLPVYSNFDTPLLIDGFGNPVNEYGTVHYEPQTSPSLDAGYNRRGDGPPHQLSHGPHTLYFGVKNNILKIDKLRIDPACTKEPIFRNDLPRMLDNDMFHYGIVVGNNYEQGTFLHLAEETGAETYGTKASGSLSNALQALLGDLEVSGPGAVFFNLTEQVP